MKKTSISQLAVLCGLALGVMTLMASAAPIGINGDQIIGGWYYYYAQGDWIGCSNSSDCDPCDGRTYVYCSNGPQNVPEWNCKGGGFYAAIAGTGATPHGTGSAALCDGPTGIESGFWFCEVLLQHATCY